MRPMRSASEATIPEDLRAAIEASPRARKTFRTLDRQNLFALAFRTNNMKTPAGRAKKIAALVAMLARGETIIPLRGRRGAKSQVPSLASPKSASPKSSGTRDQGLRTMTPRRVNS